MEPKTEGLRDRLVAFLAERGGTEVCVACLARALGVAHKSAHEASLKLEARPGFWRRYGRCASCGKTRIVTGRATLHPATPYISSENGS